MKPWSLTVPLMTRMMLLKDYKSYQIGEIQEECNHLDFKEGCCVVCDFKCEHQELEHSRCLYCKEHQEPNDPRYEPEYKEDR